MFTIFTLITDTIQLARRFFKIYIIFVSIITGNKVWCWWYLLFKICFWLVFTNVAISVLPNKFKRLYYFSDQNVWTIFHKHKLINMQQFIELRNLYVACQTIVRWLFHQTHIFAATLIAQHQPSLEEYIAVPVHPPMYDLNLSRNCDRKMIKHGIAKKVAYLPIVIQCRI